MKRKSKAIELLERLAGPLTLGRFPEAIRTLDTAGLDLAVVVHAGRQFSRKAFAH